MPIKIPVIARLQPLSPLNQSWVKPAIPNIKPKKAKMKPIEMSRLKVSLIIEFERCNRIENTKIGNAIDANLRDHDASFDVLIIMRILFLLWVKANWGEGWVYVFSFENNSIM